MIIMRKTIIVIIKTIKTIKTAIVMIKYNTHRPTFGIFFQLFLLFLAVCFYSIL